MPTQHLTTSRHKTRLCITLLCILFGYFRASAQIIKPFESLFPAEAYKTLLDLEFMADSIPVINEEKVIRYHKLCKKALIYSEDLCILYCDTAYRMAHSIEHDSMIHQLSRSLGVPYTNQGKFDIAEPYLNKAMKFWEGNGDSLSLAGVYIMKSWLESMRSNPAAGIELLYKARDIKSKLLPINEYGGIYHRLMLIYSSIQDYNESNRIGLTYIDALEATGLESRSTRLIELTLASNYLNQKEYQESQKWAEKVLHDRKRSKIPKILASAYAMQAEISNALGEYKKASIQADSAIYYAELFGNPKNKCAPYYEKSIALKNIGNYTQAYQYAQLVRSNAIKADQKSWMLSAFELNHRYLKKQGRFKSALDELSLADSLRKEIYQVDLVAKTNDLEKKNIKLESDSKIALLNQENRAKTNKLANEAKMRYGLIGFLAILTLASAMLYRLYIDRNRKSAELGVKNEKLSKALTENEYLIKEVHHRVKNNLQIISSLLNLQSRYIDSEEAIDAIMSSKSRVMSMSLVHQKLYATDTLEEINIKSYLSELMTHFKDSYGLEELNIQLNEEIQDMKVDINLIIPIGLIVTELVSNAIKHAFDGQEGGVINLSLFKNPNSISLTIKDDGKGMPYTEIPRRTQSLGMRLVKSFTDQIDGEITINNREGSVIHISVPFDGTSMAS